MSFTLNPWISDRGHYDDSVIKPISPISVSEVNDQSKLIYCEPQLNIVISLGKKKKGIII